jgi:hypothetical protein
MEHITYKTHFSTACDDTWKNIDDELLCLDHILAINLRINSSYIVTFVWKHTKVMYITINMTRKNFLKFNGCKVINTEKSGLQATS